MGFFDLFKDKKEEKNDDETFWELHKKTLENANIEAQEKDKQFLQKFCPMVDGHCRADCVNFVKAWVSDMTGMWFDDNAIRVRTCGPKCKLWESKLLFVIGQKNIVVMSVATQRSNHVYNVFGILAGKI